MKIDGHETRKSNFFFTTILLLSIVAGCTSPQTVTQETPVVRQLAVENLWEKLDRKEIAPTDVILMEGSAASCLALSTSVYHIAEVRLASGTVDTLFELLQEDIESGKVTQEEALAFSPVWQKLAHWVTGAAESGTLDRDPRAYQKAFFNQCYVSQQTEDETYY